MVVSMQGTIFACVTGEPLDLNYYAALVADPGAGAISSFTGVTRNVFQGKAVLRLEYEAYQAMAVKKLEVRSCMHEWWILREDGYAQDDIVLRGIR